MIRAVALALALALAACAAPPPAPKPAAPKPAAVAPKPGDGVSITKQQNGRFIAFVGPRLQHTEPFLGVTGTNFFTLRSFLDTKTGEAVHQLYVVDSYFGGNSLRWGGARDGDNKPLRFIAIGRNQISCESGCAYADEFAAALPEDLLKSHPQGFRVTFTADDGAKTLVVEVPGRLVAEELAAVDTVRAGLAQASAAPPPAAPPAASPPP